MVSYYLNTDGVPASQARQQEQGRWTGIYSLAALSPICLLLLTGRRTRRWRSKLLGMAVAIVLLASAIGCGSKSYTRDLIAAPGSYTIEITALNAQQGISHSLGIPLTITAQ